MNTIHNSNYINKYQCHNSSGVCNSLVVEADVSSTVSTIAVTGNTDIYGTHEWHIFKIQSSFPRMTVSCFKYSQQKLLISVFFSA